MIAKNDFFNKKYSYANNIDNSNEKILHSYPLNTSIIRNY